MFIVDNVCLQLVFATPEGKEKCYKSMSFSYLCCEHGQGASFTKFAKCIFLTTKWGSVSLIASSSTRMMHDPGMFQNQYT